MQINKNKKVTMRDVAQEVGVSLATVSYVLNHSEKEKISHEMRLKVMETAKRMNYVPNQSARALAGKKSSLIGIIVNIDEDSTSSQKWQYYDLVAQMQRQFHLMNYDTVVSFMSNMDNVDIISKRSLDAAFIIDIDEKNLNAVTKNYYVPVIFLDCDFEENLFYKILPDYEGIFNEAKKILKSDKLFLLCEEVKNKAVRETFETHFALEDIFVNTGRENLSRFLEKHKGYKGVVIGDILGLQVERYLENDNFIVVSYSNYNMLLEGTKRFIVSNEEKARYAAGVLKKLLALEYDETKENRIYLPFKIE